MNSFFQLNVVGTKRIKGIHTCTMEDLQWCLDGNLKTTFMMTQACLPYLEESKGQIINMSSFSGSRPVSVQLPFETCVILQNQISIIINDLGLLVTAGSLSTATNLFRKPQMYRSSCPENDGWSYRCDSANLYIKEIRRYIDFNLQGYLLGIPRLSNVEYMSMALCKRDVTPVR